MWRKRTGRSPSATAGLWSPSSALVLFFVAAFAPTPAGGFAQDEPPDPAGRDALRARLESVRTAPYAGKRSDAGPADSAAAAIAAPVNLDSLLRTVEDLVAFGTRYEYTPEQESAAVYLSGRFEAMGYEPFYDEYGLSEWDIRRMDFAESGGRGWAAASHGALGAVLRTDDGGATWTTEFRADAALFDVAAAGADVRWAVGDSGFVFRSASGAWAIHDTLGTRRLSATAFLDSLRGLVASQSGSIYRTDDGGTTWTEEAITTSPIYDVEYVNGSMAWAAGSSQSIWIWTPATGWALRNSGLGTISDIAFAGPDRGIAIVASGNRALVWDGGTWKEVATPIPRGYTVAVAPDGAFWIAGLDDPVLLTLVYRQVDASADSIAWEPVLFPSFPFLARNVNTIRVGAAGNVIAGGVDGLLLRSDDGAATWTSVPLPDDLVHRSRNVGAEIPGRSSPDSIVILSAHYDSYAQPPYYDPYTNAPGADDDASGVAAVIEAARLLAGTPCEKTMRFLFFSGEELGLQGSTAYATAKAEEGEAIAADVQIDMIGRSDGPLLVYANEPSESLLAAVEPVRSLAAPDLPCSLVVGDQMIYSDHASFWANGYRAVLIAEEFDVATNPLHTTGDTLGNFDFPFFERSARFAAAYAARLAGATAVLPETLTATSDLCLGVELRWSRTEGAGWYYLYRNGERIGGAAPEDNVAYFDTGIAPGDTAAYFIRATDLLFRTIGFSEIVTGRREHGAPGTPSGLKATNDDAGGVRLRWDAAPEPDAYFVLRDRDSIAVVTAPATEYVDRDAYPFAVHTYGLLAVNACGTSPDTAFVTGARPESLSTLAPYPNPTATLVFVPFSPPEANGAAITIYSAAGRRVRRIERTGPVGLLTWDRRNDAGELVAPGVYFLRVETARGTKNAKVVLVR